jgi:hypothetical protein
MTAPRLRRLRRLLLCLVLLLAGRPLSAAERPLTQVGMRGRVGGVILPAPELEVRPLDDHHAPFVLRIDSVHPHGTAFRYDFVYLALEPGTYDLMRYLRSKDGSPVGKLPPLEVEVKGLLPPGQILPHALEPQPASWFAGYRVLLLVAGAVWLIGLLVILLWRWRTKGAAQQVTAQPATVADRLRPLVLRAMSGSLSPSELAELERTLLAFWRRRLGLEKEKAPVALARLRQHPEAGILLEQLELWLHRPGTAEQTDVGQLLRPYQQVAAEALPATATTEGAPG